jgi:inorganic pyrophosphatase
MSSKPPRALRASTVFPMPTQQKNAKHQNGNVSPVQAIVETPRGGRNKYKLDEETGRMKLSKVMPEGMVFPYDFGFFPGTKGDDGDPVDVLILNDEPTFPGCQIDCRLIGLIRAHQKDADGKQHRNDRLIAVAEASVLFASVKDLADLEPRLLKQLEDFFVNYQKVRDVEVTLMGRGGSDEARQKLEKSFTS